MGTTASLGVDLLLGFVMVSETNKELIRNFIGFFNAHHGSH
jgi:hypothetical protein